MSPRAFYRVGYGVACIGAWSSGWQAGRGDFWLSLIGAVAAILVAAILCFKSERGDE
jgi:hypothetical protein